MPEQLSPLSYDYVFNHVFQKLSDTFDKYREVLPAVDELEQFLIRAIEKKDDPFQVTLSVIDMLKTHAENSELVNEIFENVRRDVWHQLKPDQVAKHEGRYYINSVAD